MLNHLFNRRSSPLASLAVKQISTYKTGCGILLQRERSINGLLCCSTSRGLSGRVNKVFVNKDQLIVGKELTLGSESRNRSVDRRR